jgi:hypothetical protein
MRPSFASNQTQPLAYFFTTQPEVSPLHVSKTGQPHFQPSQKAFFVYETIIQW